MDVPVLVRRAMFGGMVALAALGLAACGPEAPATATTEVPLVNVQNASPAPASTSAATTLPSSTQSLTATQPLTSTQPLTPTTAAASAPVGPQAIFIDEPPFGWLVGSPMQLKGRTQRMPIGGQINYQVLDAGGQVKGNGNVPVIADGAGGGFFDAPLTFTLPQNGGNITARLFETNPDGTLAAVSSRDMFVQSQVQSITIDSPVQGWQVGSPMTFVGRVARLPSQGFLSYVVTNSTQQQIGASTFPVTGEPGRPASFTGVLEFDLPFDGDTITARVYDQDQAIGASVSLYVAPVPQSISITSPPPGQLVGSPMTLKGTTTRFPANGQLVYRVTQNGNLLGSNSFAVGGTSGPGSQFDTQVRFSTPNDGGIIQLTVSDPNTPSGPVESTIDLDVRPQYQRIDILSPSGGTPVGSPMTITGNTNWFPNNGVLTYQVFDAGKAVIGSGTIPAGGAPGTRGTFNGQVRFTEPANGGTITVELVDQYSSNAIVGSVSVNVLPPPLPQIVIGTPFPGTPVGSPMTVTGYMTYLPGNNQLSYRVLDAARTMIGQGVVAVTPNGRQAVFNVQVTFTEPAAGGNITLEIFGPGPNGAQISTSTTLYVVPRP
jgi:hypothetical protein